MGSAGGKGQHLAAIQRFHSAIAELLEVSDFEQRSWGGGPTPVPKPGQAPEWNSRKAMVDRSAPAAARAFVEAGVGMNWKPPGTWNQYPVNPAIEWATILEDHPKFGLDVLEAVCNQALGSLESGAYELDRRKSPALRLNIGEHVPEALVVFIATVVAGLIVAFAAFKLGWVGGG